MKRKMAQQMDHYWHTIENGFWFKRAYEELFAGLSATKPSTWVEVGCYHGGSLAWLGVEVINSGKPVTIHAVDSFVGYNDASHGPTLRASFDRNMRPIATVLGARLQVHAMPSVEAATGFEDASCDVIWLDADHSYAAVTQDIAAWWPKLKPGGTLGGDDYTYDKADVRRAVLEAFPMDSILVGDGEREGQPWPYWMVRKCA